MTKQKDALALYLRSSVKSPFMVQAEYRFHPTRRWRFDWAILIDFDLPVGNEVANPCIAIEYDGIMRRTVGHNSLSGILRDSEKINEAQRLGWQVYRANAKNVDDGSFFTLLDEVLAWKALVRRSKRAVEDAQEAA